MAPQLKSLPFTTIIFFFFFFFFLPFPVLPVANHGLQAFIVQLHSQNMSAALNHRQWHLSFLPCSSRLLYSYQTTLVGFSALLFQDEAAALRSTAGVISVHPDRRLELHTTYSYEFLGLGNGNAVGRGSNSGGRGIIIGLLDTGVWPESPSFSDSEMPPIPSRWKGVCQSGECFDSTNCNRKLIGARFYSKGHRANAPQGGRAAAAALEYSSPRDAHGHGTHTSSTAAGAAVPKASIFGSGAGTATGMAPGAHLAVYKVCWFNGCYSSDILAGMDDAVRDGVDVLSLSLGGFPLPLFEDSIAIGSFRAVERGVAVVCAGGNNGPAASLVANEAPWITTVGAGTLNRRFPAVVRLGNGSLLYGESVSGSSENGGKVLELVHQSGGNTGAQFCFRGSLSKQRVEGKMVICDRGVNGRAEKGEAVKEAGGAAMIIANSIVNQEEDSVDAHVLPATIIGYAESIQLKSFMNSTETPTARLIFAGTTIGKSRDPAVALFSSRGPSLTMPSVLKPDIIAPGVNIIAAWPSNLGPSGLAADHRRSNFSILSGTSMACPHVSGITALLRAAHPTWTPAAVRSAIMTTADILDRYGKPIMDGAEPAGLFAMGAGHINPTKAMDPGLIYDISPDDYIIHLCSVGYTKPELFAITHRIVDCGERMKKNRMFSLNYPSISVEFGKREDEILIRRTVTNVGEIKSTYSVRVRPPPGVAVRVVPERLDFGGINESRGYRVWFLSTRKEKGEWYSEGEISWVREGGNRNRVRSPVSAKWAA